MISSFDYYKKVENPNMYLCNPDRRPIAAINAENRHLVLRFNDLSELTFTVPKIDGVEDTYDRVETKRLIFVENIGWFQITSVKEQVVGDAYSKEVVAESHQTTFKNRGFVTEERVYMFYNSNDPLDEHYDANNTAAIPSVVGQLYQQLGIKVALQPSDIGTDVDKGEWTLTYIDPALRFLSKGYGAMYESASENNICRTFQKEETYGYDFIMNTVENAFGVIFVFDFLHHVIKVKFVEDITQNTNIYLSFDNTINTLSVEEKSEDIVTVLSCNGNDLDIRTVNPMGTNYIVNFDYYKRIKDDNGVPYPWMSKELIEALNEWEEIWKSWQQHDDSRTGHERSYDEVVDDLQQLYEQQTEVAREIQYSNLKLSDMQVARDQYLNGDDETIEGAGITTAETVEIGERSILSQSRFYRMAFSESIILTCHTQEPDISKIQDADDKFHYEFNYQDAGVQGTAHSMIQNFVDSDDISDVPLYFLDENAHKTYCKLTVASDVGIVKDINENISKDGQVTIRETTFEVTTYSDRFLIDCPNGDSIDVLKSNSYFVYNGSRYRIVESADGIVSVYGFYVSGFDRYTTYVALTGDKGWCKIWEDYITNSLQPSNDALQAEINELSGEDRVEGGIKIHIDGELDYIHKQCNIQKFIKAKSDDLYNELSNYWIEGNYENDSLAALDTTTMTERIELAKELLEAGQKELVKVSQPTFSMSVESIAFIKMIEFKQFTDELELGKKITIEKNEDTHYYPALISIEYDLDSADSFSLTFSNASKTNETAMTYADLIKESASTSRTVAANWSNLMDYSRNKESLTNLIMSPLDRTLRAAQENLANQQFIVDETGILGRKWSDDSHSSFDPEQVRLINNTMLFTHDNWETASLALGKVVMPNGESAYGIIADAIVGRLIFGEALNLVNDNNSIVLDENGIVIKNQNTKDTVFSASSNGNVFVKGEIKATQGTFGVLSINGKDGSINTESGHFSVDAKGNLVAKGGGTIGGFVIGDDTLKSSNGIVGIGSNTQSGTYAFWAGNSTPKNAKFSVTNEGVMSAQSGQIGGINFTPLRETSGLYGDKFFLGTARNSGTQELETLLAFGDITRTQDGFSFTADTLINDTLVRSVRGEFTDDVWTYKVTVANTLNVDGIARASSLRAPSYISSDTGFYFGHSGSSVYYTARLTVEGIMIWLKIYNQDGQEVNLSEARTFTIHYACIWGGDTVWNATVPAGSSSTSKNTKAFWGVDYYTFSTPSTSKTNHAYSFLVSGNPAEDSISAKGNLTPYTSGAYDLGSGGSMWKMIYCASSAADLSDRNEKHDILDIAEIYDSVFDKLRPVTFKFNQNTSNRTHIGLTGQNLKEAIIESGLTTQECAAYCEWEKDDGDIGCGIRYGELVSLNIWEIQKLKERVAQIEKQLMQH